MHEFTARELAVARLLGSGHTHEEIAAELNVTHRTVKGITERIRWKLGINRSRDIPRVLKQLGVIE